VLQRRIAATDRQLDRLVDALYGLTAAELAIVEKREKRLWQKNFGSSTLALGKWLTL
jgi:hypothetical protein